MLLPGITANEDGSPHQIMHSSTQSVRPYSSNQAYLHAMREDLADWLKVSLFILTLRIFDCIINKLLGGVTCCITFYHEFVWILSKMKCMQKSQVTNYEK